MKKICPECGNHLPDEASFCLNCFYSFDSAEQNDSKKKKKTLPIILWLKLHYKNLLKYSLAALAFLIVMGICISAIKIGNHSSLKSPDTTVIVEETRYVPLTESNGVAVTDEAGEQVTGVVEVTKIETLPASTTQKQGLLDKIFNSDTKKNTETNNDKATDDKTTETTEKKGFFDQIIDSVFGTDEEESTNAPTTNLSTVEHGTTQNTTVLSSTTTNPVTTTEKPTQTTSSTVGTSSITTTENGSYYFEYAPHNSSDPDGPIAITKYVGNASVVTIPVQIDGKYVQEIRPDCFKNNSIITQIDIPYNSNRKYIWLKDYCLNNLTSLTTINLYNNNFFLYTRFAYNCPIKHLNFDSTKSKFIDGAYYYKETLKWFSAHPSFTTLTIPDWCTKIDGSINFHEVPNLKVINIHKNVVGIPVYSAHYSNELKAINVEAGNSLCMSVDGVLFAKTYATDTSYKYCVYPYSKTDTVLKLPENSTLGTGKGTAYTVNPNLEELWLPLSSTLSKPDDTHFYNKSYPNLKTIHIAEGHPQYEKIAKTFKGTIKTY
ncbi:MAG: leucine-rich repeat protein [Clostridia bacterium]|nr:leucine-rich repeat protein [Clostridia bacterium]